MSSWTVVNAFDRKEIATLTLDTQEKVKQKLDAALEFFKNENKKLNPIERSKILGRTADLIKKNAPELALLIAAEGGKPLADAKIEVARAEGTTRLASEEATRICGRQIPMTTSPSALGRWAFTVREPIGVVVAVSAFNHPLNLIAHQVAPAVAAGCPVLVKPALETPLSCQKYISFLHQSGLPVAAAQSVICDNQTSEWLVTHPKISFFNFIGSASVGWMLKNKLAPGVRCALEHGGAAPVIIDETADIKAMVPLVTKGAYYHAGQVCVSVQRIFVHSSKIAEFIDLFKKSVESLVTGDAASEKTQVGPLIRPTEVKRVQSWIDEAVSTGATIVCGGKPLGDTTYAPTILLNPSLESRIMTEEVFGPVVAVKTFENLEEAIGLADSTRWHFQASIFSQDIDRALLVAKSLDASAVMINDHTAFRVDWMPFGGRGEAGLGVGGVAPTIQDYTQEKLIVVRSRALESL